ncbi:hypothetical protein AAFC00_004631 [Neodothiora populina]|uniref:Uncharacterized protein n=1 Tax=Neodothiora populina TaxID=2781224 RepID=A0ABR3P2T6_9PEZI
MSLSALHPWVQASRQDQGDSELVTHLSNANVKCNKRKHSASLETSLIAMGINPSNHIGSVTKEVRFSDKVKIYETSKAATAVQSHVSFSDDIVEIGTANCEIESSTASPAIKKQVRFSCLKHPRQPLSHGLKLLQILKRRNGSQFSESTTTAQKRVKFGALKSRKFQHSELAVGPRDGEQDEAETRQVFKREWSKRRASLALTWNGVGLEGEGSSID